jgi:biotin synthase
LLVRDFLLSRICEMDRKEILKWLRESDERQLEPLWASADALRKMHVGDDVHLRGLAEISNYCARECSYCGIQKSNTRLERYRMTEDEIIECAHKAEKLGYGTIVLQSGEDYGIETEWFADVIRRIKNETALAVTLALGERPDQDLEKWHNAGADRYLLKFETSDRLLYDRIHPPLFRKKSDRIIILKKSREIGYETGSGVMIGIPGQTYESLADDIMLFHELDLDMIGVGPYVPHPDTPLGRDWSTNGVNSNQVPNKEIMTYKVIALTRIACPTANIPATTALATMNPRDGYEKGIILGANVIMPNLTPIKYKSFYDIYPSEARQDIDSTDCHEDIKKRILSIGRTIGKGRGDSIRRKVQR